MRKLRWMLGRERHILRDIEHHNGGTDGEPIDPGSTLVILRAIEACIAELKDTGQLSDTTRWRLREAARAAVKYGGACLVCRKRKEDDELDDDGVCEICNKGFPPATSH